MLMPSDPMIFNFSFYTEQSGTVTFETQLQFNIVEDGESIENIQNVQNVTLVRYSWGIFG